MVTLNISTTNLVNDRSVYYYKNQEDLRNANFTFKGLPGQIILVGCNDSELSDFKFTQASIGIQTFYSENMTFSNITVERSFMGLYLERTNYTKINDFYSFNNTRGIQIQDCNSNNIIDSNFSLCLEEQMYYINPTILLRFSDQNRIDNCNIDFSKCALRLESSESNEIKMNKFFQNEEGVILDLQSRNNLIHLNNFIENEIQSLDDGSNNAWDNGELGNYWDDYSGFDISPEDGIGDVNYTISGQSYSNDTFPIVYPTYDDTDGDGLKNLEEYTDGIDTYKTNVTNSDSDFDYLSDYLEWIYSTNPWDNDTDDDLMLDGWEVSNQLNPTINDSFEDLDDDGLTNLEEYNLGTKANTNDTDSDLMLDAWEVSNGLNPNTNDTSEDLDNDGLTNLEEFNLGTLPNNFDSDNDGFSDGIEVSLGTNALNIELYPKPDLSISKFNCTNENLTLTISNTGIWNATDIIVYILIPSLNLTLYNNSATPFNLTVKQNYTISINFVDFEEWLEEGESYNLSIIIDPDNRINEINELDNLESNIDFEYQLTNEETPNLFLFTMILTILAVSIPSLGASYYFVRKKGLFGFEGKDKLREEKLSEAPQKQIPTKTFPKASEIRKKKKPISRLTMEDLGGSKELTEERLEEMARTESEMELEDYKIICVVHKGEVTGNVYVCPNCKSFYCDRCAKVLKIKGESCWYCKADITLQLKDTDRLLLLEKRASALIEEILNENSEIETYLNGEKNIGEFPELKSQFFFLFNPEKLDNIDLLDLTINEKKRFIKEILNLSMEERDELIAKMLELKG